MWKSTSGLRRQHRDDGVGRMSFDFHTGPDSMATSRPCLSTVSPATAVLDFSTWRLRAARFQGTWSAGICSAQAVERRMAVIRMSSGRFWQLRRAVSLLRDLRRAQLLGCRTVANVCEFWQSMRCRPFAPKNLTADNRADGPRDTRAAKTGSKKGKPKHGWRQPEAAGEASGKGRNENQARRWARVAARVRRRRIGERLLS